MNGIMTMENTPPHFWAVFQEKTLMRPHCEYQRISQ
jgi:hypothetical protein